MENQDEKRIRAANVLASIASAMSSLNPLFLAIPVMASVANELFSFFESESTERRLHGIENELKKQGIGIESFAERISKLEEHEQYVLRNNIKHLCLAAQPETTDMLNKAIVDCIMSESFGLAEHACEILQQCNSDDIILLKLIKKFQVNGSKEEYKEKLSDAKKSKASGGWNDRNVIYGEDTTIFWKDFISGLNFSSSVPDLGALLSLKFQAIDENGQFFGEEIDYLSHLAKSIIKMQNLSVLQCEYHTTLGTTSSSNIERFHITLFGKKLLEYIELETNKAGILT